jgi:hypothetical protein
MNATILNFPNATAARPERTTILTLTRGAALRVHVIQETAQGVGTLYWIETVNIFRNGSTIVGPISGQHHAIARARASLG